MESSLHNRMPLHGRRLARLRHRSRSESTPRQVGRGDGPGRGEPGRLDQTVHGMFAAASYPLFLDFRVDMALMDVIGVEH